ncbi:CBS domain-containing protein [Pseudoponticoccus marisrubri]|uniref:Signal transduction protein n=1 Tax=Pseudoponticoccus marisrubri TaxID=1685382 RepID=A0A0W7WP85_9RHOB|nr:CBS domain-containing protein [Pseudoponticoccus marisrubri]KUF12393.1 signal transduction protein [Pseudoponticoccus marisrubri]
MNTDNDYVMKLRDRPEFSTKPKPLTFPADTPVLTAAQAMDKNNFGSVVVVDAEDKVEGIVTERDILRKIVAVGKEPGAVTLSDIMTANPRVARDTDEVVNWLRIMSNERFRRLPVVDEEGRIKVIFTQGDFVSYTWPDLIYQAKELAKASVGRNYPIWLIGGGIMLYSILMVIVVATAV